MTTPRTVPPGGQRSAPLRVLAISGRILAAAGRGLLRCWWLLLGIAALSFVLHHLLIDLGARVAMDNGPAGMALLVLAIAIRLILIAVMVIVAARHITFGGRPLVTVDLLGFTQDPNRNPAGDEPRLRTHLETVVSALGPLVLLYAGWQLINHDLHQFLVRLFDNSMSSWEPTNNSNINFDQGWKAYIGWAIGVWLVKIILERLRRWSGRRLLDIVIVYAEVGWIVLAWLVVTSIVGRVRSWWRSREVVSWWRQAVDLLTGALAPLDIDLPAVISIAAAGIAAALSVLFFQLAQPLIWVAVVGLVLGWGRSESSLLRGSRLEEPVRQRWSSTSVRRRFALDASTRGLREKYVPVLAVLRLVWRSGPLPVLTIGALYAVGGLIEGWIGVGVDSIIDPSGELGATAAETLQRCLRFLLEPLRICFLVATFAEVLRLRTEAPRSADQRAKR